MFMLALKNIEVNFLLLFLGEPLILSGLSFFFPILLLIQGVTSQIFSQAFFVSSSCCWDEW